MRPLKLTLAGFHGVRDGMRRESVTLDLTTLPNGLIALKGPNGSGKTTLMDNLHPYPIMPSHASKISVDAFSYWDHLCAPQASKELEWEHAGGRYRTAFAFRNSGKTRKAEYYLFEAAPGGAWSPVKTADGTASDGKAETYMQCLTSILGSAESFFTSQFAAQNRRPLSTYSAGEIKKLLADLLGIDYLRELSAKASAVSKGLSIALDTAQADVGRLISKHERVTVADREIATLSQSLASARVTRESERERLAKLEQERATLSAKQSAGAATEARIRELRGREQELVKHSAGVESEGVAAATRAATRRRDLDSTIATQRGILAQREVILAAVARREALETELQRLQSVRDQAQLKFEQLQPLLATQAGLTAELKGLERDGSSQATLLASLTAQSAVVDQVPCVGHAMHATCPLLKQGLAARGQAAQQTVSLEALRKSFRSKRAEHDTVTTQVAGVEPARQAVAVAQAALGKAQSELQRVIELAAKKGGLDAAAESLRRCEVEVQTSTTDEAARIEKASADIQAIGTQLGTVRNELSTLAADNVVGPLRTVDTTIAATRESLTRLDGQIEAYVRQQSARETERAAYAKEVEGLPQARSRAEGLSDEIAHWKLLAKALGNDGIIALSIDEAGPALAGIVNDLLLACYGPRFTIEIRTQTSTAKGETREGFEILVHDADNDSTKDVSVMSGGQKVWINECLTRGIALHLARHSGIRFTSLFTDEADGPLDADRKRQFMRMKREVLRAGGYDREFFISQTPELVEEADAVIDVLALAA
jgi:exonuclease SbcC